jgi:hypothetical protein
MKLVLAVLGMLLCLGTSTWAVEAHWDFGGTNGADSAMGYTLKWGTTAGAYTKTLDVMKTTCAPGTDPDGAYSCKAVVATSEFVVGTRYYFTVSSWAWSTDGITKVESVGNPTAEFILQSGGQTGTRPSAPAGLGIYP